MYRDDRCAVCGESLPPDHFYCREHAAGVDDRLHELGGHLSRLVDDVPRIVTLLDEIAPETWDWLAERTEQERQREVVFPVTPRIALRVHADDVDVDVDSEPGRVRIDVTADLRTLLEALDDGLRGVPTDAMVEACAKAEGANATH